MTLYKLTIVVASDVPGEYTTFRKYEMVGEAPNDTLVIQLEGGGMIVTTWCAKENVVGQRGFPLGVTHVVELYPIVALKGLFEDMPKDTGFVEVVGE